MRHDHDTESHLPRSLPSPQTCLDEALRAAAADPVGESVRRATREYCLVRREEGAPPERVLVELKGALHAAMGDRRPALVEQLVSDCIRHYYQAD